VFFGDHGIHAPVGDHRPAWEEKLYLQGLNVPFVLYAPKLLPAREMDTLASEVDVFPTIAGLTLGDYRNTTLGRDLFDPRFAAQRYAFTVTHGAKLQIGVRNRDYYFRMYADASEKRLNRLVEDNPRKDVNSEYPDVAKQLEDVTRAIFETAKYMRFHNGKEPVARSQ
jgi:arylsulfatase A-like enzyme